MNNHLKLRMIKTPLYLISRISIWQMQCGNMEVKTGRGLQKSCQGGQTFNVSTGGKKFSIRASLRDLGLKKRTVWSST